MNFLFIWGGITVHTLINDNFAGLFIAVIPPISGSCVMVLSRIYTKNVYKKGHTEGEVGQKCKIPVIK